MEKFLDFGLILYDGPIARSYINFLRIKNYKIKNIIVLCNSAFRFFPKRIALKLNFLRNNFYALKLMKSELFEKNEVKISSFFGFDKNFIKEMYQNEYFDDITKNIIFLRSDSINSKKVLDQFKNLDKQIFLNTGKEILKKEVFATKHDFIHIHPGYLPNVKGADCILWSSLRFNNFGVSSFFMNEKIDQGKIISRNNMDCIKIKLADNKISNKDLYRFIYSFVDPLLRAWHLDKMFENLFERDKDILKDQNKKQEYFPFMDDENFQKVKEILYE